MTSRLSGDHRPVQTSAVLVPCAIRAQANPPPSPPSPPASAPQTEACEPPDDLSLSEPAITESLEDFDSRVRDGLHVLRTETMSMKNLVHLYETDHIAREGFSRSVAAITRRARDGGKLVMTGVGKSGHVAKKLVATFSSLAIPSVFLHPTEALHGDLGIVGPKDTLMLVTFSGSTPELMALLPHLNKDLPLVLLTSHTRHGSCDILKQRPDSILLSAPVHETERVSFGVPAPATSTTMAMALGDALAIAAASEMHQSISGVFAKNHPGGAIGASFRKLQAVKDIAVPWMEILDADLISDDSQSVEVLRAGYESTTGWVRVGGRISSPSRIKGMQVHELSRPISESPGLLVARDEMISVAADTDLRRAADLIRSMMSTADDGEFVCCEDSIIAVVDKGEPIGVLEARDVLSWKES